MRRTFQMPLPLFFSRPRLLEMANNEPQLIEFKEAHKQLDIDRARILEIFDSVLETLQTSSGDNGRREAWTSQWKRLRQAS